MNSNFHKEQAEALIKQANLLKNDSKLYWQELFATTVSLAQVHATLATIPDSE